MSKTIDVEVETAMDEGEGPVGPESRSAWEGTADALLAQGREEREVAEVASDLMGLTVQALLDPACIAEEAKRRGDYLRSRPMREKTRTWELDVLRGVDLIGAQALDLVQRIALGEVTDLAAVRELEVLSNAAFAARTQFHALLAAQDEPWASRPKQDAPEARAREMAEIEAFLARKRRREARRKAG